MRLAARIASMSVLAVVLLPLVLSQAVVLPGFASNAAQQFPEAAGVRVPVLVLSVLAVGCTEVAVLCGLVLLAARRRADLVRCTDVCIGALLGAAALVMVIGLYVSWTVGSPLYVLCALVAMVGVGLAGCMGLVRSRVRVAAPA